MLDATPIADVVEIPGTVRIAGKILAHNVTYDAFMNSYDGMHVEWVNGVVIQMPSIDERHDAMVAFFRMLFAAFLEQTGGGRILGDPMLMKLPNVPSSRAPDVQVLLPDRVGQLKKNQVIGPASLVVEIVSPGSQRQDREDKKREYELGRVPEYWLFDPAKIQALFYQLSDEGLYEEQQLDANGVYHSRSLPGFQLMVALLWRDELPGFSEIGRLVEAMLKVS
ncbi:MAG: Uma2 family endonuclease [Chloroflexota bacterium]